MILDRFLKHRLRTAYSQAAGMAVLGFPVHFENGLWDGARARGILFRRRIVVGPGWAVLPYEERMAILFHEAGHCRHRHLLTRAFVLTPLVVMAFPFYETALGAAALERIQRIARRQEAQADACAVEQGYGDALVRYMHRNPVPQTRFHPSYTDRVNSINEMMSARAGA